jgi:hypothetical protein
MSGIGPQLGAVVILLCIISPGLAQENAPTTFPAAGPLDGKLPHIKVDVERRQVRLECEAVNPDMPLEFLVCQTGTKEYESLLRSSAKPSHLHLALLMIGLEPGEPISWDEKKERWLPPRGPALKLTCEYQADGRRISLPVHQLLRNQQTRKPMPPLTWVFAGSYMTEDREYAADLRGYLVSVANFPETTIDIAALKSEKNESLEMEVDPQTAPPRGTTLWLLIEPAETQK